MMKITMNAVVKNCARLIEQNKERFENADYIIGVSRGGVIPAAIIATMLDKPLLAVFLNADGSSHVSQGELLGGKKTVVVDDAARTGETLQRAIDAVKEKTAPYIVAAATISKHKKVQLENHIYIVEHTGTIVFPWDKQPDKKVKTEPINSNEQSNNP